MFNIGDTVLYGSDGVCTIDEITEKSFGDVSVEYYILRPVFDNRSTFFVPTKNQKLVSKMHPILSPSQLSDVINSSQPEPWIDNDIKRGERFKEITLSGELKAVAGLIKCISLHIEEISQKGKKLHKSDELTYKEAIKLVYEQMAMFFKISKEEIADIVCKKIPFDDLVKKTV